MLAALCVTQPRRRWLSLKRRPPAVKSELVFAGSGRFVKITADTGKNGLPDWNEIRSAAGREAGRLLIPRGWFPPESSRILPFRGCKLARKLMTSAGLALLKYLSINPRLVQITVYDPQAEMPDLPLYYLPFAADVRVVTNRPERFEYQQFTAMKHYGAVLTVSDDLVNLKGSLLVLTPGDFPSSMDANVCRGLILTARPSGFYNNEKMERRKGVVDGYVPRVPRSLLENLPAGCDLEDFLAGLYELSGIQEIGEQTPEFLHMCGHTISLRDAAWRLAGLDIGISV